MNNQTQLGSLLLCFALAACGGEEGGGGDAPDANGGASCALSGSGTADLTLGGRCSQETLLGTLLVEVQQEFSFIDGKVANAVLPSSVRGEEMAMGGCRLMRKRFPFCDPTCASDEACTLEGVCVPFPKRQDLGEVCVAGLAESYVLTAESPGFHYFNTQVTHPAFAGGERIEFASVGGSYGDFNMVGVGVTPMKASEEQWNIVEGQDLAVGWNTSETNVDSSVYLTINIDQHGSSPLLLECDLPDTGSAAIPSALISGLLTSGISGFPTGKIERRTADSVTVSDGCIEFVVRAPATVDVRVAGHTACNGPDQCPSGQTCNIPMETCE